MIIDLLFALWESDAVLKNAAEESCAVAGTVLLLQRAASMLLKPQCTVLLTSHVLPLPDAGNASAGLSMEGGV